MKKNSFIALIIITNIIFLFLHIRKRMLFIKESFRKQKYERILTKLEQKKQELDHALYLVQNKREIKQYAADILHMKPIHLNQLKKVTL